MLKLLFFLLVSVCIPFVNTLSGVILGPGRWLVVNIELCDDPEQYDLIYSISRKKINRTHDCFDINADLDRELNTSYAVQIDVYKEVDGGFKYYQSIEDDSACTFLMKNAEENMKRALTIANIDPPDCPLGPGPVVINEFVMDYTELPKNGVYGTFKAIVHCLYDNIVVGCVQIVLNFDERNDDESDEDNDYDLL